MENVWAKKDILPELETIKNLKPQVKVKLRGILSNYELVGPNVRKILLQRANYEAMAPKRKRRRRNFGDFVMSLDDKMISRGTFHENSFYIFSRLFYQNLCEIKKNKICKYFDKIKKKTYFIFRKIYGINKKIRAAPFEITHR